MQIDHAIPPLDYGKGCTYVIICQTAGCKLLYIMSQIVSEVNSGVSLSLLGMLRLESSER